jgi:peptidoglycan/LPS O-acetylase OafA/YrhL
MSEQRTRGIDFPALDVLRLIGAVAVLTTHVAFQTGEYFRHGVVGTVLARMDVGVAIFFVLSGFLLSRPWWASAATGTPTPALAPYGRKRLLRIWPVYVVSVVLALSWVPDNEGSSPVEWLVSLLMLDTYLDDTLPFGLTQMWSLSVEVAFYACLPLLMWLGRPRRGRSYGTVVLVAMVALNVIWVVTIAPAIDESRDWAPGLWLPGYLTWFAAGMWLARTHVRHRADPTRTPLVVTLGRQPGVCWVSACGLLLLAATPLAGPVTLDPGTAAQSLTKSTVYGAVGLLVVAAGIWAPASGTFMRVASTRVLRHLGHLSYSIFCLHLIVLALLLERIEYELFSGRFATTWLITMAATLVLSELTYCLVERPAMSFGGRRFGRPSERSDKAHQATAETANTATT